MHIVAIVGPHADPAAATRALAAFLGVTAYDVRPRINIAGGGPAIVARCGDVAAAEAQAQALAKLGFATIVEPAKQAGPFEARHFEASPTGLMVRDRQGQAVEISWSGVRVLLHGTRVHEAASTEEVRTQKTGISLGAMMVTGMPIPKRRMVTVKKHRAEEREQFLVLCGEPRPVLLGERSLVYDGFGADKAVGRAANFQKLVELVRQHAPDVPCDRTLLQPSFQAQILGTHFDPARYLPLTLALRTAAIA